ncbi:hypothetical protein KXQ82_18270 [Mucilaginibacter sp. HMF5004]|uniref:hypothetical protein n=1 Tax=Mucilaginibacter rivuli TaxID=2857527 RepID=UPI001C5F100C|nr:hypothetical protein [Mucilaginibacter rivuli]MBW4891676.1 hypothetical protein [Mucilaginibacter rivuli]
MGSLPESSAGNLHKLKVDVLGGAWESFSTGETTFYISNRNGLKIDQTTMGSTSAGRYSLHAYTNSGNGMDFYLLTNNYTAIAVKSCMLGGGNATQLITNTYSANAPSGVTEITPLTINPILITNELGNIGINTALPIDKFDITGSTGGNPGHVVFGDGNVYTPYMKFFKWAGSGNIYLQTTIANSLDVNGGFSFQTGSGGNVIGSDAQTTRMVITQPGNVGIGTIAPGLKFHTDGATGFPASSGTTQTGVMRLGVTGGYGSVLDFGSNGVLGQGWIQSTDRSNLALNYPLLLNPNGGNVGIGTNNPGAGLQVQKTSQLQPAIMIGGAFSNGPRLQVYGLDADSQAYMGLGTDMGGGPYEHSVYFPTGPSWGPGKLTFGDYNGSQYNTRITLLQNGNLGIGATGPNVKLQVNSNNSGTGYNDWITANFGAASGDRLVVGLLDGTATIGAHNNTLTAWSDISINPFGGRVGIGTKTPNANLEVNTNTIMGTGGDKFNTALTLIKNGDAYGIDYPALVIKHSGSGVNSYGNPGSDNGIIQITGFNTGVSNKAINSNNNFYVFTNGTVAVNASRVPTGYNFAVGGNAIAEQMTVMLQADWPDYVFEKDYALIPLKELGDYVNKNHHLPEIPLAAEVKKDGLNLGEINGLLVKKVEELTLYLIEKEKEIRELKASQEERLKKLEQRLELLEKQ